MSEFLRRDFPIGEYKPKHWLDTDRRGDWIVPACMSLVALALTALICI